MTLNDTPAPTYNASAGAVVGIELFSGTLYNSVGGVFAAIMAAPALPFWWRIERVGTTVNLYLSTDGVLFSLINVIAGVTTADLWPGITVDLTSAPQVIGEITTDGGFVPYP